MLPPIELRRLASGGIDPCRNRPTDLFGH
jgi:hypothetical protein